jgi:hypothetical protein
MIHTPDVDLGPGSDGNTASLTGTERSEIFDRSGAPPVTEASAAADYTK